MVKQRKPDKQRSSCQGRCSSPEDRQAQCAEGIHCPDATRHRLEDKSHSAYIWPRDGGRGGFNQWEQETHGPQVRELRPQGPGTLQLGKPAMGMMDGDCLVSAGLHRAMSPVLTWEQGCPHHPQNGEEEQGGALMEWSQDRMWVTLEGTVVAAGGVQPKGVDLQLPSRKHGYRLQHVLWVSIQAGFASALQSLAL